MTNIDWNQVYADIRRLKNTHRRLLKGARGGAEHVTDYLNCDEPQMALESLCLDLMDKPTVPLSDLEEMERLGKLLGLDKQSVYDPEFWEHLTAALTRRRAQSG
jgi:hypothetical protein